MRRGVRQQQLAAAPHVTTAAHEPYNGSVFGALVEVPTWLHAFVQDAHNLDQAGPNGAVVEDMHKPSHPRLSFAGRCMSQMKAANPAG
jgi:hypothetical protein